MDSGEHARVGVLTEHIKKLLTDRVAPELPPEAEGFPDAVFVHEYLVRLRTVLDEISRGRLSVDIPLGGFLGATLKGLQASLLHLTWQIQQVGNGNFACQIDFLGEFSSSFNDMVAQLDAALTELRHKEEELTKLADTLRHEVTLKGEALSALSRSEANFRYMASHDPLTGVLNRRSFFDAALAALRAAQNAGEHCCLLLFDLDEFKKFNDTYGHLDGDEALRHVTAKASESLRKKDVIGRYGGEEFICLFPMLDARAGWDVAERLRKRVAASPVCIHAGQVCISVSIGYVSVPPDGLENRDAAFLEKVLRQVDDNLYKAKRGGRNRTEGNEYSERDEAQPMAGVC